jgi:peptidoglycan hydrolase CwlO-like protein
MQSDPTERDLVPSGSGPAPLWVWLLVVVLGAATAFSTHSALTKNQLYWESETAREALVQDKSRLEANVTDLKQQVDQANAAREETANALKQSRADTETAHNQITDLQNKINDLDTKLNAAQADAKQANAAKDMITAEVDRLKTELADTQKKLAAAQADLAQVQAQNQQPQAPTPH